MFYEDVIFRIRILEYELFGARLGDGLALTGSRRALTRLDDMRSLLGHIIDMTTKRAHKHPISLAIIDYYLGFYVVFKKLNLIKESTYY